MGNNEPVSIADEVPFEIPESWEWARIGSVFNLQAGKNITSADISDTEFFGSFPCYGGNGLRGYVDHYNRDGYFPLIGRQGALCGNINFAQGKFYATEHAVVVESFGGTDVTWAGLFLEAMNLNQYATATAQPGLAVANINKLLIPIPPVPEQIRIVVKFSELIPYVLQYDQTERRLATLNEAFPEQLKKSILQLAVQGKLVPQDPNDEPASVLLERIRVEKERLITEGKIKRDKNESVIFRRDNSHYTKRGSEVTCIDDEIPFDIPESWQWCELSSICSIITDGEHKTPRRTTSYVGYYLLSARNIRDGFISLDDVDYVDEEEYSLISKRCNPQRGDVLISCSGSVGRISVVCDDNSYVMVRSAAMASPVIVNSEYLMYAMQSDIVQAQIKEKTKQAVQANLFQGAIRELFIPLPPLQEQSRICAALRPLLRLCKFSL